MNRKEKFVLGTIKTEWTLEEALEEEGYGP